jgi:hypothetical protein
MTSALDTAHGAELISANSNAAVEITPAWIKHQFATSCGGRF